MRQLPFTDPQQEPAELEILHVLGKQAAVYQEFMKNLSHLSITPQWNYYYCCPINSIKYKNVVLGHCVFSGRVLFYSSKPPQKIDNW